MKSYDITPIPKPRMTRSDKWKKRPCVVRYHEFKDKVRSAGITITNQGCRMVFVLPMPKSWSKKQKAEMNGRPHQQTPDTDNLVKALLDAVYEQDCEVYHFEAIKIWGEVGRIIIDRCDAPVIKT